MAGKPKLRAMLATIHDAGGIDHVLRRVADGETLTGIARSMGLSRSMLSDWLNDTPERAESLRRARATSASALAEQALELADTNACAEHGKTRLQIEMRRWLAGRYSPDEYADQKAAAVTVNVGSLHLDALRNSLIPNGLQNRVESQQGRVTVLESAGCAGSDAKS